MPVTPFHFGVGVLAKGLAPRAFSVSAFMVSQIVIDLEPAYLLFVAREWPVHRWAHTYLIGSMIGVAAGLATWAFASRWPRARTIRLLMSDCGFGQCLAGGFVGGATHSLLDGVMYADVTPLIPFDAGNPFLGSVSLGTLHLLCVLAGLAGLALLGLRRAAADRRRTRT